MSNVTLREDRYAVLIISCSVLLRMRSVSDRYVEKFKIHILCSIKFYFFTNSRSVYELRWKNIVELDRPCTKIWRMRISCWELKATNTLWEYVNIYCFSTATIVEPTRLNVTLYDTLSFFFIYLTVILINYSKFLIAFVVKNIVFN